ncbi:galactokinase family protein [uncultured Ruminococcus sp.]|uniref:galactokinase n=1 Tax=uncultured Ruminococcus sp. TaxID=165186 RepID=UPI00262118D8|nr:galactokinase family protein [uncultured Ruminococcus sp.]
MNAVEKFKALYPNREEIYIYSAPGRTEIGGNHTDHQHGCVLAAAVDLDIIAVVAFHNEGVIRVQSAGYPQNYVDLNDLSVQKKEMGSSSALIRGIASGFHEMGVKISGFDAYTTSDVLSGSGLSSSAAFEVLIGTIIDSHYNRGKAGAVEIAKIGQYAENIYFGKKSGLMDQMVSSVGGLVSIDFHDTRKPAIKSFPYNFEKSGYCLCVTDTKGSHANLTDDYVAVRSEMESIASQFEKKFLRDVNENEFYSAIPQLREKCSDRAVMRAAHFFAENRRAVLEANALSEGNISCFLELVRQSGESSATLLQNLYSCSQPTQQEIPLGIMLSQRILGEKGAVRVHGGGFAGTIQAFVPAEKVNEYSQEMNRIFGDGSCYILRIRPVGGIEITEG